MGPISAAPHFQLSFSTSPQSLRSAHRQSVSCEPSNKCGLLSANSAAETSAAAQQVSRRAAAVAGLLWYSGASPAHSAQRVIRSDGQAVDAQEFDVDLRLVSLHKSVPQEWPHQFQQALNGRAKVKFSRRSQLEDFLKGLGHSRDAAIAEADAVTLGDAWLGHAIQQRLVQPIPNAEHSAWWKRLGPQWRSLVRRNPEGEPDPNGLIWAAPYRWGCTLFAVRVDLLARHSCKVEDWADLWQPALRGRLGMLDSPRDFVGAALRSMGVSANSSPDSLAKHNLGRRALQARVDALRSQVRLFSSRDLGSSLHVGDISVAVGWSGDLVPWAARSSNIVLIAPASGTLLYADLWAVPRGAKGGSHHMGPSPLLQPWLEFCNSPQRAIPAKGLRFGAAPTLLPEPEHASKKQHKHGESRARAGGVSRALGRVEAGGLTGVQGAIPDRGILARSEFLHPLDVDSRAMYWDLLHRV